MISRPIPIFRAIPHLLPVLLVALLPAGCSDRILPADGSANLWGGRKILYTRVDEISGADSIHTMSLDGHAYDEPALASGFLLCPPSAGRFIYTALDIFGLERTMYRYDKTGTLPLVTDQPGESLDEIAALSPDGEHIAYVTRDDSGTMYLNTMRADGTQRVRRAGDFGVITGMIFSPDGRYLGISSEMSSSSQSEVLHIFDISGDRVILTIDDRSPDISLDPLVPLIYWFQWMPDGRSIMYQDFDVVDRRWIMIAPIDGSGPRTVVEGNYTFPAPSPDGKWIAAIKDATELWVMKADGSGARRLASSATLPVGDFLMVPQWSSDGSKILLLRVVLSTLTTVVEVVDVPTGRRKALQAGILPASWLEE